MERYWVYLDSKVTGPVDIPSLRKLPGFTLLTQVCREGEEAWRVADEVIEIKAYFLAPPRASQLAMDSGNAAPKLDSMTIPMPVPLELHEVAAQPDLAPRPAEKTPAPIRLELSNPDVLELPKDQAGPAPLRVFCSACGYKNPRDVTACMKCGTPVGASAAPAPAPNASTPEGVPSLESIASTAAKMASPSVSIPRPADIDIQKVDLKGSTPMVEIPIMRIVILLFVGVAVGAAGLGGMKWWKKHQAAKTRIELPNPRLVPTPKPEGSSSKKRSAQSTSKAVRASLPGVAHTASSAASSVASAPESAPAPAPRPTPDPKKSAPVKAAPERHAVDSHSDDSETVSYKVIEDATPQRRRTSAPPESSYSQKRRADKGLWTAQEEQAIGEVQRYRIYGGQRTVLRNTEILMQILRDREYSTAFESGKRLFLYNDMDWGATQKDGPIYEIQLTFSGGKEADGSPRKPLKFAFTCDRERGTVAPGGNDQIRANTLHAFFDESRIPPEERRAIAKDVEELVLAGQPEASPLALDTVSRQFSATYTPQAMARVADAFGLRGLSKKINHTPKVVSDAASSKRPADATSEGTGTPSAKATKGSKKMTVAPLAPSKGGPAQFRMERGMGRERTVTVQAVSVAPTSRLWELLTGYDRLKQFVPNMLVSEKEGQDGAAAIVHTVALTKLLFFVFKVNLHMRVIEHPLEHELEFERIAGEFESFRGSVQIAPDASNRQSTITFRATVVPKGRVPDWALRDMARKYLVPVMDAIRSQAEAN